MPKCDLEELPNREWRFKIYLNHKKWPTRKIKQYTQCDRIINLGTFRKSDFAPTTGIITNGKERHKIAFQIPGVTVSRRGELEFGYAWEGSGKANFIQSMGAEMINGKTGDMPTSTQKDGLTMIGFKADGTPVWMVALKAHGKTPRKGEGATPAEAVRILRMAGCVNILRFDTGWNCHAFLKNRWIVPGKEQKVFSLLLAYRRTAEDKLKKDGERTKKTVFGVHKMVVNTRTAPLTVRSYPGVPLPPLPSNIVGSIPKGTKVDVFEIAGDWARIGADRWVNANLLR